MKSFFPMDRLEAAALGLLILFSAVSFLPAWRTTEIAGLAVFGWLMAGLMVLSPAFALFVLLRDRAER